MADPAPQPIPSASPTTIAPERWSLLNRIWFRFACVYLVFYCWPYAGKSNLFDAIPSFGVGSMNDDDALGLTKIAEAPWHALCPWVAVHIFHLHGPVTQYHVTGSGDTTLDYVLVFCFATLAAFAALVWSVIDRRRPNYRTLYAWLRLLIRFTLAFTMLSYGFAKVYPLQFMPPFLSQLTETYGESSPMGILWTFMGASTAYSRFCGLVEVSAGLLLLFRRTTSLGALVAAGAMLNVAALNFCYDVPVKLYSAHLILMSLFLLIPDAGALARFFLFHKPAQLDSVWLPRFQRRWLRTAAIALQTLVIVSVLYNNIWGGYRSLKTYSTTYFKRAPLYGIWNADSSTADWHQMIVEFSTGLSIRDAANRKTYFQTAYDEPHHTIKLTSGQKKGDFTYSQPDAQHLVLRGSLGGNPIVAEFHRLDASKFLLTSRGFHWINEDPFNR
ncbi:MAG: hypothetical protein ABSF64_31520 [Bryobacteraceae bacterium]|jgi:hypothetical protein